MTLFKDLYPHIKSFDLDAFNDSSGQVYTNLDLDPLTGTDVATHAVLRVYCQAQSNSGGGSKWGVDVAIRTDGEPEATFTKLAGVFLDNATVSGAINTTNREIIVELNDEICEVKIDFTGDGAVQGGDTFTQVWVEGYGIVG